MAYLRPEAALVRTARSTAGAPTAGTDEVQTLTIGGTPTAGTMTFTFRGRTTAPVTWTATDATLIADVDAALEALDVIGSGGITAADGTLTSGIGTITLTFAGAQAKKAQPLIVCNNSLTGTNPTAVITETTPGVNASFRGTPKGGVLFDTTNGKQYINTGTASVPTWTVVGAQS
jgi:hypothetical protein